MERAYLITELTDLKIDFSNYDRLELGDPTCEWSFLKLLKEKTWLQRLTLLRKPLSIVFPPLSEGSFAKAMPLISKYREINGSIEWVVNDFGTLQSVSEIRQGHDRVVFGNFLVNQSKDPALALFSGAKNHRTLPVDNTFYAEYFRHWWISAIEVAPTIQGVDMRNLSIELHLLSPYTIYSMTRYCYPSLIHAQKKTLEIVTNCPGCIDCHCTTLHSNIKTKDNTIPCFMFGNRQLYAPHSAIDISLYSRIIDNHDLLPKHWL